MRMERSAATGSATAPAAKLAVGLAAAAIVLLIIFAIAGIDSAIWLIVGALGLAAAIVGWRAGGGRPQGLTLGATVVGAVIALMVVIWGIVGG